MDWRHAAICRDETPELFFPVGNSGPALLQIAEAKTVCRRCPVVSDCLAWALERGEDAGVWGGDVRGRKAGVEAPRRPDPRPQHRLMDARTRRRRLARIASGQVLFTWTSRGWLVVGPTAVLMAAVQPPRPAVVVTKRRGRTVAVRVMRVVGTFTRDGVDYATAIFTRLAP